MELKIGSRIMNLRKELGVTQEQLAHAVGVSTPAVSKWETGNAYPDITLLPSLARFFNVSIDTLLCFEKSLTEEQVIEINRVCARKFEQEPFEEAVEYCEGCLQEYPDNLYLKFRIGGALIQYLGRSGTEENFKRAVRKAIRLFKESAKSMDPKISLASQAALSSQYMILEEYEKAEKILLELPKTEINPDILLPTLYMMQGKEEQARKLEQKNLLKTVNGAMLSLTNMITLARKSSRHDIAITLAETQRQLIQLFHLEKFLQLSNCVFFLCIYTEMKDVEKTLQYLEEYTDCICDPDFWNRDFAGNPFFDGIERQEPIVSAEFSKENMIRSMKMDPTYEFIHEDARYKALEARLTKLSE